MTFPEHEQERFDWVHPSWRDVIIEHLMKRPIERQRFLRHCGVAGLELALSVSGGRAGERELPLLRNDDDWLALRRRAIELAQDMTLTEHLGLLAATRQLLSGRGHEASRAEQATTLAREILPAIIDAWNGRSSVLTATALQLFYATSELVRPLCAGPQLERTLDSQLKPGYTDLP